MTPMKIVRTITEQNTADPTSLDWWLIIAEWIVVATLWSPPSFFVHTQKITALRRLLKAC